MVAVASKQGSLRAAVLLAVAIVSIGSLPVAGQSEAGGRAAPAAAPAIGAPAPAGVTSAAAAVPTAPAPRDLRTGSAVAPGGQSDSYREAFGFKVGEERRYVLEPERSLRAGESGWWSITLEEIRGDGDDLEIIFALAHRRSELLRDIFGGSSGRMQVVDVESKITMNRFGFPERVVIDEQSDLSGENGSRSDQRTTTYEFDGRRYVKQIHLDGHTWDFKINIPSNDDVDLDRRAGLYAFMPSALSCLGIQGTPGRPTRCSEGEVAFANPGLLSVVLPVMWEEQVDKREFLFFKPAGIGTEPSGLIDINRLMRSERDSLRNITRYFDETELEFEEYVEEIEVGPRTVAGWKVDAGGGMREFYTDGNGLVLKLELDPHPVTRGSRWIRLLYPSEY